MFLHCVRIGFTRYWKLPISLTKMILTKMYELERSMVTFQDAQGQLTQQSLVESGPNSNLYEI